MRVQSVKTHLGPDDIFRESHVAKAKTQPYYSATNIKGVSAPEIETILAVVRNGDSENPRCGHTGGFFFWSDMSQLQLFKFGAAELRVVGDADHPWWVAADVCEALGIAQVSKAVGKLDEDEKGVTTVPTLGGDQTMVTVNESGLYSLILKSRKEKAKAFKKWITSEVIPAIRKTGTYTVPAVKPPTPSQMILVMAQQMVANEERIMQVAEEVKQIKAEIKTETHEAKRLAAAAVDIHTSNYGFYTILAYCRIHGLPCDIRTAAKHGRAMAQLCRTRGITVSKIRDNRFGEVGQYPEYLLDEYFDADATTVGGAA
jgi:prophage antirepressor-like protein